MLLSPLHTPQHGHPAEDIPYDITPTPTTVPMEENPVTVKEEEEEDPDEDSEAHTDTTEEEEEITPVHPTERMIGPINRGGPRLIRNVRKRVHLPQTAFASSSTPAPAPAPTPVSPPHSPLSAPTSTPPVSPSAYLAATPPESPSYVLSSPAYTPLSPGQVTSSYTPRSPEEWAGYLEAHPLYGYVASTSTAPTPTLPDLAKRVSDQDLRIDHLEDVVDIISNPAQIDSLKWDVHSLDHQIQRVESITEYLATKLPAIDRQKFNEDRLARVENRLDKMQAQIDAMNEMVAISFRQKK